MKLKLVILEMEATDSTLAVNELCAALRDVMAATFPVEEAPEDSALSGKEDIQEEITRMGSHCDLSTS